ncbi:unnamed protein product, partial [Prorocentrum cordatum]
SIDDYVHRIGRTARGKDGRGHALVFFEYWHRDPFVAMQLIEVLQNAKQAVPDELKRIAGEVARGQRDDVPELYVDTAPKPAPPTRQELEQRLGGAFRRLNLRRAAAAPAAEPAAGGRPGAEARSGGSGAGPSVGEPVTPPAAAEGAPEAHHGRQEDAPSGPAWRRFSTGDGRGCWWWCEERGDWFLEADPGDWRKFSDPASGRHYWWRDDAAWFWIG